MKFINKYKRSLMAGCLLVVVALVTLAGGSYSKYKEVITLDSSLTVASGALAQEILIQEHGAVQREDGLYQLGTDVVDANTYYTVAGVTVPKDPYMTVTGKSKVDAYLFLEVVEGAEVSGKTGDAGLNYSLNSCWRKVDGAVAKHGGTVYVYTNGISPVTVDETSNLSEIQVFENSKKEVTIGRDVDLTKDVSLKFYGYLGKAANAKNGSVKEVFNINSTSISDIMETAKAVVNEFDSNMMDIEIGEKFSSSNGVKTEVHVKNTGNASDPSKPIAPAIYVRVRLLTYWYESTGSHIVGKAAWTPEFTPGTDWVLKDGFYYYKKPLNAGEVSSYLIEEITLGTDAEGNRQVLEILAESIPAYPKEAVDDAWPGIFD